MSLIRSRASSGANHSTRSISGIVIQRPERGGHWNGNVLLCAVGRVEVALERPRHDVACRPSGGSRRARSAGRPAAGGRSPPRTRGARPPRLPRRRRTRPSGWSRRPRRASPTSARPGGRAGPRRRRPPSAGRAASRRSVGSEVRLLVVETSGRCGRGAPARTSVRLAAGHWLSICAVCSRPLKST